MPWLPALEREQLPEARYFSTGTGPYTFNANSSPGNRSARRLCNRSSSFQGSAVVSPSRRGSLAFNRSLAKRSFARRGEA
jgi:hypothetical protein